MDSMRAVAALSVVVFHLRLSTNLPSVSGYFDAGVVVFFLISAFLLYRPFARAHMLGSKVPLTGPYAWRRFLRIVPAYWVALTIAALVLSLRAILGSDGLLYYGFGQVYRSDTLLGGLGVAWTLCIEVTLYAFLPLWAWLMRRIPRTGEGRALRNELLGCALLAAISIAYQVTLMQQPHPPLRWLSTSLLRYLDTFALGMALAALSVWWEERPLPAPFRPLNRFPGLSWLCAGLALWVLTIVAPAQATHPWAQRLVSEHWLYTAVGFFLLLPCIVGDQHRGLLRRGLALRPVVWVGMVSYAVYLYHVLVIHYLQKWHLPGDVGRAIHITPAVIWVIATVGITLVVAALSWNLIELPALRLAHRPPKESAEADARATSPAMRVLAGVFGAALVAAGLAGVGYVIPDVAIVLAGCGLVALALGWRPTLISLPTVTTTVVILAVVAAVVPMLLKPRTASGTTLRTQTTTGQAASAGGAAAAPSGGLTRAQRTAYLVLSFDGKTLRLYVNGKLSESRPTTGPADPGAKFTEIGAYLSKGFWSGAVDELALYRSPLTPQTVADHYRLGTKDGSSYASSVSRTSGIIDYWRLDNPRSVKDSVGSATATTTKAGALRWISLIQGSHDPSLALNGKNGAVVIKGVPVLRNAFSVEVWVTPGARPGNRTVVSRPGGWFLKTDILGHWTGGFLHGGHFQVVASPLAAHAAPLASTTRAPTSKSPSTSPSATGSDSTTAIPVIVLLLVVGFAAASFTYRRRRRSRGKGEDGDGNGAVGDGPAADDGQPPADRAPDASVEQPTGATR